MVVALLDVTNGVRGEVTKSHLGKKQWLLVYLTRRVRDSRGMRVSLILVDAGFCKPPHHSVVLQVLSLQEDTGL